MLCATITVLIICVISSVVAWDEIPAINIDLKTGTFSPSIPGKGVKWVTPVTRSSRNTKCDRQGVLKLTFDLKKRKCVNIYMEFDTDVKDMAFDLGDSVFNNGWGGDANHQSNNAEVHANGKSILFYGRDNPDTGESYGLVESRDDFLGGNVTLGASNEVAMVKNGTNTVFIKSYKMFALKGQRDTHGSVNYDLYLGMNRAVASSSLIGSGLCRVVVTYAYFDNCS